MKRGLLFLLALTLALQEARAESLMWPVTPGQNRTSYLLGQSAFMLEPGEAFVRQKEVLLTTMEVGVFKHFSIRGAAAVPFWADFELLNLLLGLKGGLGLHEYVHIAFSVDGGASREGGAVLALGTVTLGPPNANLTVSSGGAFTTGAEGGKLLGVSGLVRVSRHVALVSDNWLILPNEERAPLGMSSVAVRVFGEELSADFGLVVMPFERSPTYPLTFLPLPWVDVGWHFG